MAKAKVGDSRKITFGKRRSGRLRKTSGPKAKKVSKYRGQGR
mgnify:CR=1 FL=1|jgi:hypothetical protein